MNALVIERLILSIDGVALFSPLDLEVAPGTVTSIIGPSGSGKSSLLAFVCGILPDAIKAQGTVRIGAEDLTAMPAEQRGLGLMFQDALLFPHLSVAGNLLFGLRSRERRGIRRQRVHSALESVGLLGFGERDPATLSGGQKTRVALLRVLLSEPRALLLDEPFSALDEANRVRVRALVFKEAIRRELPTLLVTHDEQDVISAGGPVITLART